MKVTNSDIIKSGERELIDTIIGDLDWSMIEKIIKSRHHLKIQDDIDYRRGDLIVHDNQVAYKLDFDVKMTLSVIFDRDGNYLSLSTSEDFEEDEPFTPGLMAAEETAMPEQLSAEETAMLEQMDTEEDPDALDLDDALAPDIEATFSSEDAPSVNPERAPSENFSKMASHIAEMISEINDD